jgi:hypothetical protein
MGSSPLEQHVQGGVVDEVDPAVDFSYVVGHATTPSVAPHLRVHQAEGNPGQDDSQG